MSRTAIRVSDDTMNKVQKLSGEQAISLKQAADKLVNLAWTIRDLSNKSGKVTVLVDGEPHHVLYD